MQVSEELKQLKDLQKVLAKKYEIEKLKEDKPKELGGLADSLEKYKKELVEINEENEAQKTKVAALRAELDEAVRTRESGEKGMDAISTHREYEVLGKQISDAKEKEDSLRKVLLVEEKKLSELSDRLSGQESLIKMTSDAVKASQDGINAELDKYNEELSQLAKEEAKSSEGIDGETIIKFQRIIRRNSNGIVAVKGNVCDGCHMILPDQFANEVRRGEKLLFCPYCSRILFYEEAENVASNYFSDNTGSLLDDDEESEESEIDGDDDFGSLADEE